MKGNEVQPRCRRSPAVVSMIMARRGVAKTTTTTDREESQVRQKKSEREKSQQVLKNQQKEKNRAQQDFHLRRSTENSLFTELCKCCLRLSFSAAVLTLNGQGWRTKPRCPGSLCPSSTGTNPSQSPWQGMKPGTKQTSYQRPVIQGIGKILGYTCS